MSFLTHKSVHLLGLSILLQIAGPNAGVLDDRRADRRSCASEALDGIGRDFRTAFGTNPIG
jgi:hypothetical protein